MPGPAFHFLHAARRCAGPVPLIGLRLQSRRASRALAGVRLKCCRSASGRLTSAVTERGRFAQHVPVPMRRSALARQLVELFRSSRPRGCRIDLPWSPPLSASNPLALVTEPRALDQARQVLARSGMDVMRAW